MNKKLHMQRKNQGKAYYEGYCPTQQVNSMTVSCRVYSVIVFGLGSIVLSLLTFRSLVD